MKKIPSLFQRDRSLPGAQSACRDEVTPGCEWVIEGIGTATRKYDGACCMIKEGVFYKRYDAKHGKIPPAGFMPAQDPDPVTGHWTGWVRVVRGNPADKWFIIACENTFDKCDVVPRDGTYEACGPHFGTNAEHQAEDCLIRHGVDVLAISADQLTYEGLKAFLAPLDIEGIVFYHPDEVQMCKVKKRDFGLAQCAPGGTLEAWNGITATRAMLPEDPK